MVESGVDCISTLFDKNCKGCFYKHHLFLSGGLAVGKTTILNYLHRICYDIENVFFVHEYIDFDIDGERCLEQLHNGLIRNYQFQRYVLRCYEKQFVREEYKNASVVVWERHLSEALSIFCEDDKSLSDDEREDIRIEIERLCVKYNVPDLNNNNVKFIKIDTSAIEAEQVIQMLLNGVVYSMLMKNYNHDLFVLLYCGDLREQFRRIRKRGRKIELELYTEVGDLLMINNRYLNFYIKHER